MKQLLTVIPYSNNDVELAKKSLAWIKDLSPRYNFPCLMAADAEVSQENKMELHGMAKAMFEYAETVTVKIPSEKQKWPLAPNLMFYFVAYQIEQAYKLPWLWLEPDAIPLKQGWLNDIAEAYSNCPKRFMGAHVVSNGEPDLPPVHMSGIAVYPNNTHTALNNTASPDKPFDISSAGYVIPRSVNTKLIQHFWGKKGKPPVFSETGDPTLETSVTLDIIKPEAVIFHRCKDGSLIDQLRRVKNSQSEKPVKKSPALTATKT